MVHGNSNVISQKINTLLLHRNRRGEILTNRHDINRCPDCYQSTHIRRTDHKKIALHHIHLAFAEG